MNLTFRYFKDTLDSGLRVVTIETPHLHSAMLAVYVRVGSRHETAQDNGVSHFLEHLFFRGSARYPDTVRMNSAVEAVGGNLNGVTTRDLSWYFTPLHPEGMGVGLSILGDMLSRPALSHLEIEKQIILEEMLDEVDERGRDIDVDNLSKKALFGRHPLGLKIAGTPKTVKAVTLPMLRKHLKRHYVTGNVVVAAAGPIERSAVLEQVRRAFRHLPRGPSVGESPPALKAKGPRLIYVNHEEAQVEFRLSFPTVPDDHPDFIAFSVLRRVLDDGLSSRLPYNIVEKRGLAYSVGAALEAFHDTGLFEVDGACAPGHAAAVVKEIGRTLGSLREGKIALGELKRARDRHRIQLDFLQDSPGDLIGWFAGTELFRTPESFEERSRRVEAVSLADLVRVARTYLTPDNLCVVAVGARTAKPSLEKAVRRAEGLH